MSKQRNVVHLVHSAKCISNEILLGSYIPVSEGVVWRCSRKGVLRNLTKFTAKHLCQSLCFNKVAGLRLWGETLAQMFSCEFWEISQNNVFTEHLQLLPLLFPKRKWNYRVAFRTQSNIYYGTFCKNNWRFLPLAMTKFRTLCFQYWCPLPQFFNLKETWIILLLLHFTFYF